MAEIDDRIYWYVASCIAAVSLDLALIWWLRRRARATGSGQNKRPITRVWQACARWTGAVFDVKDEPLAMALFGLGVAVYALTRFVGLDRFPIYFFCDEAAQTVLAADFVHNGWRDFMGRYFPTYFQNWTLFNLSVSVYVQIIPYLLFGKSVIVTRGAAALISLFGAVGVSLTLKNIFNARWWWLGVLLLSITPAWFLHSRTAFETAIMASFYAWFVYCYLLYRQRDPRCLFPALLFGALAFYSYAGGQAVVVLTGLALLLADARYHWANRRVAGWGLVFLCLLVLPYVRFRLEQPGEALYHLRILDSYWLKKEWTLADKLRAFWNEYSLGLSPAYWYLPNHRDMVRHQMKDYGHILPATLPLALVGLLVCARHIRAAAHRTLIIALLAAPAGGAITAVGITRVLTFVIPAALLTALGLEAIRSLAAQWSSWARWQPRLAACIFSLLSLFNVHMLNDALVNGPTWFTDYGLGGMQYGARQIWDEIKTYLVRSPQTIVLLSPSWANGTDYLLRFFTDDPRVRLDSIDSFARRKQPLTDDILFIMLEEEYRRALADPKFADVRLERTLRYPDGRDGFYFVRLRYSSQTDALFAQEAAARKQLVSEDVIINGEKVLVRYSVLDAGRIQDIFDGDTYTLGRVDLANPGIVELAFPTPRALHELALTTGSMTFRLTVRLYADEHSEPVSYMQFFDRLPPDPTVTLRFERGPDRIVKARLEIQNADESQSAKIHIREIALR